jgi:hypothetical protein
MKTRMRVSLIGLLIALIILSYVKIYAAEIAATKGGKKVWLKDDGTWEYYKRVTEPIVQKNLDPTSSDEAIEAWKEFRADASSHKGEKVTWKVVITVPRPDYDDYDRAYLPDDRGIPGFVSHELQLYQGNTELHANDVVVVRGKFFGISQSGKLMIKIISEKVIGVN